MLSCLFSEYYNYVGVFIIMITNTSLALWPPPASAAQNKECGAAVVLYQTPTSGEVKVWCILSDFGGGMRVIARGARKRQWRSRAR